MACAFFANSHHAVSACCAADIQVANSLTLVVICAAKFGTFANLAVHESKFSVSVASTIVFKSSDFFSNSASCAIISSLGVIKSFHSTHIPLSHTASLREPIPRLANVNALILSYVDFHALPFASCNTLFQSLEKSYFCPGAHICDLNRLANAVETSVSVLYILPFIAEAILAATCPFLRVLYHSVVVGALSPTPVPNTIFGLGSDVHQPVTSDDIHQLPLDIAALASSKVSKLFFSPLTDWNRYCQEILFLYTTYNFLFAAVYVFTGVSSEYGAGISEPGAFNHPSIATATCAIISFLFASTSASIAAAVLVGYDVVVNVEFTLGPLIFMVVVRVLSVHLVFFTLITCHPSTSVVVHHASGVVVVVEPPHTVDFAGFLSVPFFCPAGTDAIDANAQANVLNCVLFPDT
jgi:hypothetical protein